MHDFTEYFKEQPGFDRFINKLKEKYASLSKFSGTIKLENITTEEAKSLGRLFGMEYQENSNITLSVSKFIKIMENSKYEDFDIKVLVEEYTNTKLITNKEKNLSKIIKEIKFYEEIFLNNEGIGKKWLKEVITDKKQPYLLIHTRYLKNKEELRKELYNIITLLNNLPEENMFLPIYSSKYTKDPHYLDIDTNHSNLFLYGLSYIDKEKFPTSRQEKIELLKKFNIEVDSISNFVITYNLKSNDGRIEEFRKANNTLILNVQNILSIDKVYGINNKVFIFENPSILSEVISKKIPASIIITSGNPNTAFYLLADKLINEGNKLYYNGDFDSEGLLIAEKLKEKYKENIELFCYENSDYQEKLSSIRLTESRIKKLSKVKKNELQEIKQKVTEEKLAVYQENNKENIITFIKKEVEKSTLVIT